MTNQHPITPPAGLVDKWSEEWHRSEDDNTSFEAWMLAHAAQWGADQELEACCEWIRGRSWDLAPNDLRAVRRPKPLSLKKQALADFDWMVGRTLGRPEFDERSERIRRALEALPE